MQYHQYDRQLFGITNAWVYLIFAIPPKLPGVNLYMDLALDFFNASLAEYLLNQPGCCMPHITATSLVSRAALAGSLKIVQNYFNLNNDARHDPDAMQQWLLQAASSGNLQLVDWLTATETEKKEFQPNSLHYHAAHSLALNSNILMEFQKIIESFDGLQRLLTLHPGLSLLIPTSYNLSVDTVANLLGNLGDVDILKWVIENTSTNEPINLQKILNFAAAAGHEAMVRWLCDAEKRAKHACAPDINTLTKAARSGNLKLYQWLAKTILPTKDILTHAICSGNVTLAQTVYKALQATGADMNELMQNQLNNAIASGQLRMVQWIMEPQDVKQFPHQCTTHELHQTTALLQANAATLTWLTDKARGTNQWNINFFDSRYQNLFMSNTQLPNGMIRCHDLARIDFAARAGILGRRIDQSKYHQLHEYFELVNTQLIICLWNNFRPDISSIISQYGPALPDVIALLEHVTTTPPFGSGKPLYTPSLDFLINCLQHNNLQAAEWLLSPERGEQQIHLTRDAMATILSENPQLSQEAIALLNNACQQDEPATEGGYSP